MLSAGDFFTGVYPPGSGKERRFIVLTDEQDDGRVVWAYLSTSLVDKSCVVQPVDHPKIVQTCVVVYQECCLVESSSIYTALSEGALTQHDRLAPEVVGRAFDALFASELTSYEVLDFCEEL